MSDLPRGLAVIATDPAGRTVSIGPVRTANSVARLRADIAAAGWPPGPVVPCMSAAQFRGRPRDGAVPVARVTPVTRDPGEPPRVVQGAVVRELEEGRGDGA